MPFDNDSSAAPFPGPHGSPDDAQRSQDAFAQQQYRCNRDDPFAASAGAGASSRPHLTRLVTAATTSSSSSDEAYYSYSSDSGRPLHYILPSSSPATAQEQGQAGSDTGLGFAGYADSSFHQQEKREQQQQQQQQQQQYTPDRAAPSSYLDSPLFALPRPSPTTAGHTSDSSYSSEVETNPLLRQNLHLNGTPKRPLNSFMIYSRFRRPILQDANPRMKVAEVAKLLAEEWKQLPAEEKKRFQDDAKVVKRNLHQMHPDYVYTRRANGARKAGRGRMRSHSQRATTPGSASSAGSSSGSVHTSASGSTSYMYEGAAMGLGVGMGLSQAHHRAHIRQSPSPYTRTRARSRTAPSTSGAAYPPGMSPSPPPAMPLLMGPPFSEPPTRRLDNDLNASTSSFGSSLDVHSPAALLGPLTSAMDLDALRAHGTMGEEGDSPLKGYSTSSVARRPPNEVGMSSNGSFSRPPACNIFSPPPAPQPDLMNDTPHGPSGYLDYIDLMTARDVSQVGPLLVPSVFQDPAATGQQDRNKAGTTDGGGQRGDPEKHAQMQDRVEWILPPMPASQLAERHARDWQHRERSHTQREGLQQQHRHSVQPHRQERNGSQQRPEGIDGFPHQRDHDEQSSQPFQHDQRKIHMQQPLLAARHAEPSADPSDAARGFTGPKPEPIDASLPDAQSSIVHAYPDGDPFRRISSTEPLRPGHSPYPPSFSPPQQGAGPAHYPSYIIPDTPAPPASASFMSPSMTQYGTPPEYAIWSPAARAGEQGRSAYESYHDGTTPWASAHHTPPPRLSQAQPAHVMNLPSMPAPPLQFDTPDSTAPVESIRDPRRYGMVGGSSDTLERAAPKPVRADQRRKKPERTPAEKEAQVRAQRQAAAQPDRFKLPPVNPLVPLGHTHVAAERSRPALRERYAHSPAAAGHAAAGHAATASAAVPSVMAHAAPYTHAHSQTPHRTPQLPPIDSLNLPRQAPRSVGQSSFHTYSPTTHRGERDGQQERRRQ